MAKTKVEPKTKSKTQRGAKCKYVPLVLPRLLEIEAWCRDGYTDEMIYTKLGISKDSFYEYRKNYSEFAETLKKGKAVVDIEVENSLLKRAMGYDYEEVTEEARFNRTTEQYELEVTKKVTKHVQPDTTAQIFWLNNRKPKDWRNKQEVINKNLNTEVPYETFLKDIKNIIEKQM